VVQNWAMVRATTFWLLGALVFMPAAAATAQPVTGPSPTPPCASSSSPPTADSIDSPPEQVVWLRSGAILRGRIVEYAPGERVVLQLATRELLDEPRHERPLATPAPP